MPLGAWGSTASLLLPRLAPVPGRAIGVLSRPPQEAASFVLQRRPILCSQSVCSKISPRK